MSSMTVAMTIGLDFTAALLALLAAPRRLAVGAPIAAKSPSPTAGACATQSNPGTCSLCEPSRSTARWMSFLKASMPSLVKVTSSTGAGYASSSSRKKLSMRTFCRRIGLLHTGHTHLGVRSFTSMKLRRSKHCGCAQFCPRAGISMRRRVMRSSSPTVSLSTAVISSLRGSRLLRIIW